MANSDFGGNGLGMRNGHAKLSRASAKEKSPPTKKGRAREADVMPAEELSSRSSSQKLAAKKRPGRGVRLERRMTTPGTDPLDAVVYERRSSIITNPDGIDRLQDGGRRDPGGLEPARDRHRHLEVLPQGRPPRRQGARARRASARSCTASRTRSARPASSFGGYFATKKDADTFEAELSYLLVNQYGAFNSPVWFNCGLCHEYGIAGSGGNWAWDEEAGDGHRDEDAPTSARSARRASSSRSTTT